MRGRVRQVDIARRLGVSQTTVSLVLSGRDVAIGPRLRERVLRAARDLDYRADPVARSLAGGSNRLLGVATFAPLGPGGLGPFGAVLAGIEAEAAATGHDLVLFPGTSVTRLGLADGGLLLGADADRRELARLIADRFPFVFLGPPRVLAAAGAERPAACIPGRRHGGEALGRAAVRMLIDKLDTGR
ncbi:LacI family DNA-binding transcriptional regulator [Dactylosporangium sp. NPDC000244]|uniref:LacI family DNA-binding transcriptional regulator n=1 Tax=Dactylosporangium sp. NPDC000244 TaxID=3154365 RepID=UPI003317E637